MDIKELNETPEQAFGRGFDKGFAAGYAEGQRVGLGQRRQAGPRICNNCGQPLKPDSLDYNCGKPDCIPF